MTHARHGQCKMSCLQLCTQHIVLQALRQSLTESEAHCYEHHGARPVHTENAIYRALVGTASTSLNAIDIDTFSWGSYAHIITCSVYVNVKPLAAISLSASARPQVATIEKTVVWQPIFVML